jgi:hypothetical protein
MKSIAVRYSTDGCWMPNNYVRLTGMASFDKIDCTYRYFTEDTTYPVLFRETFFVNYLNLNKVASSVSGKIAILCFGAHLMGPCFGGAEIGLLRFI